MIFFWHTGFRPTNGGWLIRLMCRVMRTGQLVLWFFFIKEDIVFIYIIILYYIFIKERCIHWYHSLFEIRSTKTWSQISAAQERKSVLLKFQKREIALTNASFLHPILLRTRQWWTESAVYQMSCCLTFSLSSQPNSLSLQPFFPNGGSHYAIHSLFSPLTMKSTKNMKPSKTMKPLIAFVVLLTLSCFLVLQPTNPSNHFT